MFLKSVLFLMTPYLLASLGGLFTELTGSLNIALEGLILTGAFFSILTVWVTGSLTAGVIAGMLSAVILAVFTAFVTVKLKSNFYVTALAANLMAGGLATTLSFAIFKTKGTIVLPEGLSLGEKTWIPLSFLHQNNLVYISWLLFSITIVYLYHTVSGLRLRSTGINSKALQSSGCFPDRYIIFSYGLSGLFCGLAGSFMSLSLGAFVPGISAGKGWMSLVIIYLGQKNPKGIIAAAFFFALLEHSANYLQGHFPIPSEIMLIIPTFFTLLMLIASSLRRTLKNRKKSL